MFASGQFAVASHGLPEAFEVFMVPCDAERCFPVAVPGWSAVLSLGVLAGTPWLVNPLLTGLNLWLAHRLFERHLAAREATLAVVLLALSPWHVFTGMTWMQHTVTLTFGLAAALATSRCCDDDRLRWPVLAGIALGAMSLVRLQDAAALAPACALAAFVGARRLRWTPPFAMAGSAMAVASLVFLYNHATIGDAFGNAVMDYMDALHGVGHNHLGFGPDRGMGWTAVDPFPGHSPLDALTNIHLNLYSIQVELFGWAGGSLALVLLALPWARPTRFDAWLGLWIVGWVAMASVYWFSGGPDIGARYWYPTIIAFTVWTVRSLSWLAAGPASEWVGGPDAAWQRLAAGALLATLLGTAIHLPWRAVDKYPLYRGFDPSVRDLLAEVPDDALVLLHGNSVTDYGSTRMYSALDANDDGPLAAWVADEAAERALLAAFPERAVVHVSGPGVTGGGYRFGRPEPAESAGATSALR